MNSFEKELMKMLGYHLYCFRVDNKLSEIEMIGLLSELMKTRQFKKEYRIEEE